jgi:Bacterial regulatory proteins, gntR family
MPESPQRTAVYRHFDAQGDLLYLGISIDPEVRLKAHRDNHEPWVQAAVRYTVEWHDTRADALKAEADAIRVEHPRFNLTHNYDDAPFNPESWTKVSANSKVPAIAELMRSEIVNGRWIPGQRIPSLRTLGDAAGASVRIVSKASVALQNEGLLDFQPGRGLFVTRTKKPRLRLPHDWPRSYGFPG